MTATDKLIAEYEAKVRLCDKELSVLTDRKRKLRASDEKYTTNDELDTLYEMRIVNTKRQCYIQVIYDLSNLA